MGRPFIVGFLSVSCWAHYSDWSFATLYTLDSESWVLSLDC